MNDCWSIYPYSSDVTQIKWMMDYPQLKNMTTASSVDRIISTQSFHCEEEE
jgi:hypothetical protein